MLSHAEMMLSHKFAEDIREHRLTEAQKDYIREKWETSGFYLDNLEELIKEAKRVA